MSTILVTGGAGYIGSHTCKALKASGHDPVVLDDLSLGHRAFVKWGPFEEGSLSDEAFVAEVLRRHDIDAVIHFAAFAYVGESMVDPARYYGNNVGSTLALLSSMRRAGCDKLVFSSTCAVYGEPEELPITEKSRMAPLNPYGWSKLMCEQIIADYGYAYRLKAISLRYFNASGDDPDGEIGELRDPETHLIPRALLAQLGYIEGFQVFGDDFPTPDGTAIRDYIHVADLADAHVAAVDSLLGGGSSGVFNLGVGRGYSVGEVLAMIEKITGRALPPLRGPRRPGDPARLVADASQAARVLGFRPKQSDLHTIIASAWRWHQVAHPSKFA